MIVDSGKENLLYVRDLKNLSLVEEIAHEYGRIYSGFSDGKSGMCYLGLGKYSTNWNGYLVELLPKGLKIGRNLKTKDIVC